MRGRDVAERIADLLILAVLSISCSEMMVPEETPSGALEYRFPSEGEFVAMDGPGTCMGGKCNIEFDYVRVRHTCVCHLPGIGTIPQGPPPQPPAWPITWPTPPGIYWNEWGGGGWRPPGSGGETCDPTQFDCYEFEATLSCPVDVERGTTGTCTIDAAGHAVTASKWYFRGPNGTNEWSSSSSSWGGILVESGDVRADIVIDGTTRAVVESRIEVVPRTAGKWSNSTPWQGKISYVAGQGPDCGGNRPARYTVGLVGVLGWFNSFGSTSCSTDAKQRVYIDPIDEEGFRTKKITSGPNANRWYVEDASWWFKGTSRLNKGLFSNATQYTISPNSSTTQAQDCVDAGKGRSTNFYEFNRYCRPRNVDAFIEGARNHEYSHHNQGWLALRATENRLYVKVEGIVRRTEEEVNQPVDDFHDQIQSRFQAAVASEEIFGNWQGSIWLWRDQTSNWFVSLTFGF